LNGKAKNPAILEYYNWRRNLNPTKDVNWANSLFVANDVNINPKYELVAKKIFESIPQKVDFGNSLATTSLINNWVARETRNKITNLIDQTNGDMAVMFLSAIYFKGLWKYPFDSVLTRKDNFYIHLESGDTRTVQVDMMSSEGRYRINQIEQLDAMSLELPYTNSKMSMVVLLPRTIDGMNKLIANLDQMNINDIAPKSKEKKAPIKLPKFKFDVQLDLENAMTSLGLGELFRYANLSVMSDFKRPLHVSKIIQKAVIEVDEEGSTASAAQGSYFIKT